MSVFIVEDNVELGATSTISVILSPTKRKGILDDVFAREWIL